MTTIVAPKITVDEFKVETLNLGKKFINISFGYTASVKGFSNKDRIKRTFNLGDNVVTFIMAALNDIKRTTGTETAVIDKEEEMKEKLTNIMNRLLQEVNDLAKVKDHERYMKAFNRLNCYKVTFPEIIV
ncbi:MAG: hypothetical protein N3G19_01625 [Candidatus Pacearchaeota archaeon]|nr:hypothetical protein [Candidatus Pacearchaeota archaeon]